MRRPPSGQAERPREARRRGAVERRVEQMRMPPAAARRIEILRRQHTLAERVVSFLRDGGRDPRKGLAAGALLLAAAGGALAYDVANEPPPEPVELAPVQPLAQEVRTGLPTAPGRYPVESDSITRDAQGVYRFAWTDANGVAQPAAVSLLRQAPSDDDELEIPAQGDPILYLQPDTPIGVIAQEAAPPPSSGSATTTSRVGGFGYVRVADWYPYSGSYSRSPVYSSPPSSTLPSDGRYTGSVESPAPRPAAARTISVPSRVDAVSGMSRGTGGGSAATSKSGVSVGKASVSAPRSSGFSTGSRGGGSVSSS
jgi:hypothetical protein